MTRLITNKTAHYSSYLLILLATACSQHNSKDHLALHASKSIFTTSQPDETSQPAPKEHETIWDRLVSLYALPEIDNARIDREVNFYLKNPEYLARVQQRAEPYLYFILNEIEAKNIPGELALLPVVESAFRPDAKSPAQASGLWQFIPPTGRLYGLKQNSWYDARRDVVASTKAATTFLKELSEEFNNDWLLALASYNAGKGTIGNAVARNRDRGLPTDFWSLDLNNETSAYVPRLLAVAKIFANADKYNVDLKRFPNEPYFELVDVKSQLDLGKAAELAETSIDDFFKLNPGFNRWSTDPTGPHHILVPADKADDFKEKLAELPYEERIKWVHHTVGNKESLKSIAHKHNASIEEIARVNHLDTVEVNPGKILLIPISYQSLKPGAEPVYAATTATPSATAPANNHQQPSKLTYTVKPGDTLWKVSQQFSVDKEDILEWNKLSAKSAIKPGQKLTIKKSGHITVASAAAPSFRQISYTIKKGDTLLQLARKFDVSITDLRKWNGTGKNNTLEIKPGQKIKVMLEGRQSAT